MAVIDATAICALNAGSGKCIRLRVTTGDAEDGCLKNFRTLITEADADPIFFRRHVIDLYVIGRNVFVKRRSGEEIVRARSTGEIRRGQQSQ